MPQPSIEQMLKAYQNIIQKKAFVPSTQAAQAGGAPDPSGGMPPGGGAPPGMPADPSGGAGMAPPDPSMMGAPPMDPTGGGGAPMDPSGMGGAPMIAPDGSSPMPPDGGAGGDGTGGKGGGGVKVKPEDIVQMIQLQGQILAELKLGRDLTLDMMKQMNLQINPDTLRSSVASAGAMIGQQAGVQ